MDVNSMLTGWMPRRARRRHLEQRRTLFKVLATLAVVVTVIDNLPDLWRYMKMETM